MQPELFLQEIRATARDLPPPKGTKDEALARLRTGCARYFAKLPEPPVYLRREDPLRVKAVALREEGGQILALGLALVREIGEEPQVRELLEALEAHLTVLCHLEDARLSAAELSWDDARAKERAAMSSGRKWKRTDANALPVFDPRTQRSRYDPRESKALEVRVCCPHCRMPEQYRFPGTRSEQTLTCPRCKATFIAFFGELSSARSKLEDGQRHYALEFEELSGPLSRAEFSDSQMAELGLTRGDLIALTYLPDHTLRCVQNLSSGQLLWVSPGGACFIATVAYGGTQAPELETFRRFRDRALLPNRVGRLAVRAYYAHGPRVASWIAERPRVRSAVRRGLERVRRELEREKAT